MRDHCHLTLPCTTELRDRVTRERWPRRRRFLGRPRQFFSGVPAKLRSQMRRGQQVREGPAQPAREPYPAEKARGGEIVLNTPLRRWVFIGGLAGAIALVLLLGLVRWAA